jgi:glycosidase
VHELKKSNIHVIIDINPSSTSEQHPWAAHWLLNRSGEYQYFYVNVSDDQIDVSLLLCVVCLLSLF